MPLFIKNEKIESIPRKLDKFFTQYPHFKESARNLSDGYTRTVGPEQLLYVGQREYGGTSKSDGVIKIIGSEDATTCHLVVVKHTGTERVCLGHFDGCGTQQGLKDMVSFVQQGGEDGRIEIYLAGGFKDDRHLSEDLSVKILNYLCKMGQEIHLELACITDLNTVMKNGVPFPIIYGIALDVQSGEIYKARFTDKGPDLPLRSARHFTGGDEMLNIYNPDKHYLTIGPFTYRPHRDAGRYCQLPNHIIRKNLSTSPEQEPEGFEDSVRAAFVHLRDFPYPHKSHFPKGRPRCYFKEPSGTWTPVEE